MQDEENHRENQQQVNHPAGDVEGKPGYAPNSEQYKKQHQKNKVPYHDRCSLVASRHHKRYNPDARAKKGN
jgi:hypothetical protein